MGLIQAVRETRALDASTFARGDVTWSPVTEAGVTVTEDVALSLSTFLSCVLLRAEAMMSMPVDAYTSDGDLRRPVGGPRWLVQPNTEQLWPEFINQVCWSMDLDGNVFLAVIRDRSGRVVELWVLPHQSVQVVRLAAGSATYVVDGTEFQGEMMHLALHRRAGELRGVNRVRHAAESFGVGIAAQNYAGSWFGSGSVPPGVIESPTLLSTDQIQTVRDTWVRAHAGKRRNQLPAVLTGGAKYVPISVNPETAQLLSSRSFSATEICSIMGVPSDFIGIGVQGSSILYQNVSTAWTAFVRRALLAPMTLYEARFSDLMPPAQRMRFRPDVMLKPDPVARIASIAAGIAGGIYTQNEGRAFEDYGPLPGGDALFAPRPQTSEQVVEGPPPPPAPPAQPDMGAMGGPDDGTQPPSG